MIAHAVVLSLLLAAAQSTTAVAPPKESAVISGVVVDRHTGTPVRSAVVRLSPPYGRGISRTVTTDAAGRFEFASLPADDYVLSAARIGYLPTNFGEQRMGGPGVSIRVADGEARDDVAIPMSRGGAISGRVVDELGDAAPGALVQAMRYEFENGTRVLRPVFVDRTDDRGEFRLFTLPAGQDDVYAVPASSPLIGMVPPGTPPPIIGPNTFSGAIATYHPNSPTTARARPVTVAEGRETGSANVALVSGAPARVRGRAITASGEPFARVSLALRGILGVPTLTIWVMVREDGSFEAPNVPPGEYNVTARTLSADADAETARAQIMIAGENIDDLVLVGARSGVLRGTMISEDGGLVPLPSAQIFVRLLLPPDERGAPPPAAMLLPDHTFEFKGLVGRFRLTAELKGSAGYWAVKAIRWRGEDVTDRVFDFRSGEAIDGLEVVLSERWATLSGVVRDDLNAPVGDTGLLLFPADESLWTSGSRYIRPMRTDREGRYGVSTLLPGAYLLAVSNDIETRRWDDVPFLRSLVERATQVTLKDEDDLVFDLRIARSP